MASNAADYRAARAAIAARSKTKVSTPKSKAAPKAPSSRARTSFVARSVSNPKPVATATKSVSRPAPAPKPAPTKAPSIKPPAPPTGALRTTMPVLNQDGNEFNPLGGPPSIEDYLTGDTTFQDQQAQLRQAYAEFVANQQLDQNNYNLNYATQVRNLNNSRDQGFSDLQDDFAGRGLLKSGLYADAYSKLQDQFSSQQAQIDAAKAQYESGLTSALAGFQNDQNTTSTSARQEAIARRAAKFNLGV